MRAQYRWAYVTSTLLPLQEIGQNQHEKGGWAYNTSWAYNTYSTVCDRNMIIIVHADGLQVRNTVMGPKMLLITSVVSSLVSSFMLALDFFIEAGSSAVADRDLHDMEVQNTYTVHNTVIHINSRTGNFCVVKFSCK